MVDVLRGSTLDELGEAPTQLAASTEAETSVAEAAEPAVRVAERFGRYVVLGVLGRGGMGVVLEAFDPTLDRRVAVKVLQREVDAHHSARLVREARALAKLSHPHVVQVYEVGEVDGRGFVAMELVRGRTLRQWAQQERRPSWRECVAVYLQAGEGLAAAHAAGLVHRDFKPANAIIDETGRVRVLDFGLVRRAEDDGTEDDDARAVASTDPGPDGSTFAALTRTSEVLTRTGAVLGTPAYMAPEQLRGREADARSDQFGLCVSLYEAVYGERPFEGGSLAALMVSMTSGVVRPPPKGSNVPRRLREALLRGLAADPDARWPVLAALLAELQRCVQPRGRRWLGLGVVTGVVAIGAGLGMDRYAEVMQRCTGAEAELAGIWDEERRQELERAIVGTGLAYAEGTWTRVQPLLQGYATTWVAAHTEACEATTVRHEQSEEALDLRMACLRERKVALSAAVKVLAAADAAVVEKAVAVAADLPGLSPCHDVEALQLQRQRVPPPTDPQVTAEVLAVREGLAEIEAERSAGRYARALEQVVPVVERAAALGYAPLEAEAVLLLGRLESHVGRYADAERDLLRAHASAARQGHDEVVRAAASSLAEVVGYRQARHAEGLVWIEQALPMAERTGDALVLADSVHDLGVLRYAEGKYDEAERQFARALELERGELGEDHPRVADALHGLGMTLQAHGRHADAEAYFRHALSIRERALGEDHPLIAQSINSVGLAIFLQGRYAEAEAHYRRALELRERTLGLDHPLAAQSMENVGLALTQLGRYDEAEALFRAALQTIERVHGKDHPNVAQELTSLGDLFMSQGRFAEAEPYFRRALGLHEALGPNHPAVAMGATNLANALAGQRRYAEAEPYLRRSLAIVATSMGEDHPNIGYPLVGLVDLMLAQERYDEARELAERAVSLRERGQAAPDQLANARFRLARALWADEPRRARALALAGQARDALASAGTAGKAVDLLHEVEAWLADHVEPPLAVP